MFEILAAGSVTWLTNCSASNITLMDKKCYHQIYQLVISATLVTALCSPNKATSNMPSFVTLTWFLPNLAHLFMLFMFQLTQTVFSSVGQMKHKWHDQIKNHAGQVRFGPNGMTLNGMYNDINFPLISVNIWHMAVTTFLLLWKWRMTISMM